MDLFDSIEKKANKNLEEEYQDFKFFAEKYASQGFDEDMIEELLQIEGCGIDNSKALSKNVIAGLPEKYHEGPPESYDDVRDIIERSILNSPLEKINEYFSRYENGDLISNKIASLRVTPTKNLIDELHNDLSPLIENLIFSNRISSKSGNFQKTSQKERIEKELFGVWPIEYLFAFENKIESEEFLIKKASKRSKIPNITL